MTLAATLLLGLSFSFCSFSGIVLAQSAQTAPDSSTAVSQPQEQQSTPQSSREEAKPSASSAQQRVAKRPSTAKRAHARKKTAANCGTLPKAANGAPSTPSNNSDPATTSQQSAADKPCSPSKVVVRHGGTSEPSIQLAGGPPSDQTSQQKNAVNQLLGSTEENLKKISGKQLTADQQGTVTQIRQFIAQSKEATSEGDMERAHTLASKAQMLSEDLVNPK